MKRIVLCFFGLCLILPCLSRNAFSATPETTELNLRDFGAVGDGVTNDGPAFQAALNALAAAGGGTLFVPEGKYAITTQVIKNFKELASSITIKGVESLTPVSPPSAPGAELALGLDLLTEIYPRTGVTANAIQLEGLQTLIIKDIAFVGTANVITDATNTLFLSDIDKAQIKHSEFYGLASMFGGSIVTAQRSDLEITQCKFLGSTATSGLYAPVVQNLEWYGITVTDTVFLDYGTRELYSKTFMAASISWVSVGSAAPVTNHSPRREMVIRNTFLDEGSYWGLSSLAWRYSPGAPIDLIYITGLEMNVSNFGQYGHWFSDVRRVFVEKSRYGWSHNASAAISLANVGSGIFDNLICEADADKLVADANTGELTVINSTYTELFSLAHITNTITTGTADDDPVQYVRSRFTAVLGREPDPAAHFYWSDLLIHCFDNSACVDSTKAALNDYLSQQPLPKFAITGHITNDHNIPLDGVTVTLSGSQSVKTITDAAGNYAFSNLPTSGRYVITPSKDGVVFDAPSETFITPVEDQTADFSVAPPPPVISKHSISGRVLDTKGNSLAGVTITLSGSVTATATTAIDGSYVFTNIDAGSDCTVTALKEGYLLSPSSRTFDDLSADMSGDFEAALLPVLLTAADSDRAIALELTTFIADPFPITSTLLSAGHNRTRLAFFGKELGLLPGEGVEAITAEAEDAAHIKYPLRVEFLAPLPELPDVHQIVIRLNNDLGDAGDVFVTITIHGLTSKKVRIGIGHPG